MSVPIEAPPERPGHVGHTPQPQVNLGLALGRIHDLAGGIFGSAVVRALVGHGVFSEGTTSGGERVEYAMQPFGIPGRSDARTKPPSAEKQALAHAHTLMALEEAAIKFGRGGGKQSMPRALDDALSDARTWRSPR